jgi:hypothetical protein
MGPGLRREDENRRIPVNELYESEHQKSAGTSAPNRAVGTYATGLMFWLSRNKLFWLASVGVSPHGDLSSGLTPNRPSLSDGL